MTRNAAAICTHRTLWISDVHLGSPGCQARRVTDFLNRNDCETLYLVGDIFDGWKLKNRFFWTPDHSRVIKAVLAKARHGTKVYYLTGNHDEFMRQFVSHQLRLGKVRLANEVVHTTADGRRLLVVHGDKFDFVMTRMAWLSRLGDFGYEALLWSSKKVNGLRRNLGLADSQFSSQIKVGVKAAVQYLSGFDEQVLARCRKDKLQGVVCGHTHHAETRPIRAGIFSYNCGDWVESCTALGEDFQGRISILHADAPPEVSQPRVRQVNGTSRHHSPLKAPWLPSDAREPSPPARQLNLPITGATEPSSIDEAAPFNEALPAARASQPRVPGLRTVQAILSVVALASVISLFALPSRSAAQESAQMIFPWPDQRVEMLANEPGDLLIPGQGNQALLDIRLAGVPLLAPALCAIQRSPTVLTLACPHVGPL